MAKYQARKSNFRKTKKLYVIATEGARTEKIYFDEFKPPKDASIRIKVLPNTNHKTRPKEVLNRLTQHAKKTALNKDDELWLVIDRDSWEEAELQEVAKGVSERGFKLALSNPCFELWLYLHMANNKFFNHRDQVVAAVRKNLGKYEKSEYDAAELVKNVDKAIERAKGLDSPRQAPWPKTQGTHVYLLVEGLLDM